MFGAERKATLSLCVHHSLLAFSINSTGQSASWTATVLFTKTTTTLGMIINDNVIFQNAYLHSQKNIYLVDYYTKFMDVKPLQSVCARTLQWWRNYLDRSINKMMEQTFAVRI